MPGSRARARFLRLPRWGRNWLCTASILAVAALGVAGCATQAPRRCATAAEKPVAQIVFGRVSESGRGVSEVQFARFLHDEVRPRFPDGLTVVDAQGRWTRPAGLMIRDPSKTVMIVLRGNGDERAKLEAVRTAYRRLYHQNSVLMLSGASCVAM